MWYLTGIAVVVLPRLISKDCGAMRCGQECINLASLAIQGQRVCAGFGRDGFLTAHDADVEDVYYPGIADRDVQMAGAWM